ncbi:hypothetical protein [Salinarimonas soli]|uniref:Uncharacterized protein n=1 Tax=Salinarimonas soli TaxID=1638099 RepID=A0A5B2VAT5_9HYPH|nr:hypothetical protein [Salinarimonas soli]KAA2235560.1 hypothetical protein F0L46_18830 [Salinarimonas soli]
MQTYKVTVATPTGRLHLSRDTALSAIETARSIKREGLGEVIITDPSGQDGQCEDLADELGSLASDVNPLSGS